MTAKPEIVIHVESNLKEISPELVGMLQAERSARNQEYNKRVQDDQAKRSTNETVILGKLKDAIAQASDTGIVVLSLHDAKMLQGWISRLDNENKVYKEHCGS